MLAKITVVVSDRDGNEAATTRNVVAASSVAGLVSAAQSFEAAIGGLSNGRVARGSVSVQLFRRSLPPAAVGSDVVRQLLIVSRTVQGYAVHSIPSGVIPIGCGAIPVIGSVYRISSIVPGQHGSCLSPFVELISGVGERDELGRELSLIRTGAILAR